MTRKGGNKKKIFNPRKGTDWIILGILIIFALVLIAIVIPVDALTRDDIAKSKTELAKLETKLKDYEKRIPIQQQTILDIETKIKTAENEVKKQKAALNDSYKAFEALEKAKANVIKLEKDLILAKQKLQDLINEKNKTKAQIIELEKKLANDNIQIKLQEQPDFSQYTKLIGITLSKSCITMLKESIVTTCPPPEILVTLDTSNTEITGEFAYIDGFLQRNTTNIKNSYKWYQYDNQIRIIYDPPFDMSQRIKMIEIRPNFDVYYLRNEMSVSTNTTDFARVLYHDRFIDNCKFGIINSEKWQSLLPDTIYHMRLGCTPQSTQYIEKEIIPAEYTEFDITTSNWYKYSVWLDNVTKHCIFKYKACPN